MKDQKLAIRAESKTIHFDLSKLFEKSYLIAVHI